MKKILFISLVLLFVTGIIAFAQDSAIEQTDLFVKTMPITKIYTHNLGYKVVYLKNDMTFAEFYVPLEWFDMAGSKAVIVKGTDPAYPYFSVFWKAGEFHSIKLYVKSDFRHQSWGSLSTKQAAAEDFNIEEPELDF